MNTDNSTINESDLKIETYKPVPDGLTRMPINGIRIAHKPSGIVESCDVHSSAHKNRAVAMEQLRLRLGRISPKLIKVQERLHESI